MKNLPVHHIGIIIKPEDLLPLEKKYHNKFHKDETQGTRVMFVYDNELNIYKEFIIQEGRAKNIPLGFYHVCYSIENKRELEVIEGTIKNNRLGYPLTKLEKSGSKECGYVKFFFLKNYGFVEFNILNK